MHSKFLIQLQPVLIPQLLQLQPPVKPTTSTSRRVFFIPSCAAYYLQPLNYQPCTPLHPTAKAFHQILQTSTCPKYSTKRIQIRPPTKKRLYGSYSSIYIRVRPDGCDPTNDSIGQHAVGPNKMNADLYGSDGFVWGRHPPLDRFSPVGPGSGTKWEPIMNAVIWGGPSR